MPMGTRSESAPGSPHSIRDLAEEQISPRTLNSIPSFMRLDSATTMTTETTSNHRPSVHRYSVASANTPSSFAGMHSPPSFLRSEGYPGNLSAASPTSVASVHELNDVIGSGSASANGDNRSLMASRELEVVNENGKAVAPEPVVFVASPASGYVATSVILIAVVVGLCCGCVALRHHGSPAAKTAAKVLWAFLCLAAVCASSVSVATTIAARKMAQFLFQIRDLDQQVPPLPGAICRVLPDWAFTSDAAVALMRQWQEYVPYLPESFKERCENQAAARGEQGGASAPDAATAASGAAGVAQKMDGSTSSFHSGKTSASSPLLSSKAGSRAGSNHGSSGARGSQRTNSSLLARTGTIPAIRRCAICVVDWEDFHGLLENITVQKLVELHGEYIDECRRVFKQRKGTVDTFIGDKLVSCWNATGTYQASTGQLACSAALQCHQALHTLTMQWCAKGVPEVKFRASVVTGDVLTGHLGAVSMRAFTLLGPAVKAAFELNKAAKELGCPVVVGHHTREAVYLQYVMHILDIARPQHNTNLGIHTAQPQPPQQVVAASKSQSSASLRTVGSAASVVTGAPVVSKGPAIGSATNMHNVGNGAEFIWRLVSQIDVDEHSEWMYELQQNPTYTMFDAFNLGFRLVTEGKYAEGFSAMWRSFEDQALQQHSSSLGAALRQAIVRVAKAADVSAVSKMDLIDPEDMREALSRLPATGPPLRTVKEK
eukprot:TRINITY_DN15448_c0_g1_i1.p1 TRINITY_DN15448_c0_g1~~TRINITY_DN15448_c0_g1_i1.p1  ORF type:complete len:717 (-),score=99.09 TRINITY_DN15448_c0_g1_i1:9-2159(-)